jgi:hypothetical protein
MRTLLLLITLIITLQPDAFAHTRSQSFSQWETVTETDNNLKFIFSVDQRRITQLAQIYPSMDYMTLLQLHLTETINVSQNKQRCLS